MPFIEAPTTFYLGRRFDPTTRRMVDEVVYYDSRDLTTHAVVVGMTGSGKTGLCITLLEEAVLDNIPSIIIDPKGDITNLLLAFPDLKPEDFAPWVNIDDARRAGLEVDDYSVKVAQKWRDGLASWDISPERIAAFKQNAHFSIYTPGSDTGLPVSIVDAMGAPDGGWQPGDDEFHREQISGIVTALLALIGKNVEPVKDREHVLIANIFEHAWRRGQDLTLEDVILQVQKPPFGKLGVFDIDTFFPEKERFSLAMELNHIIASPSFQSWIQGEPLDIQSLLYTPEGKPRVSIFYIAHLTDAERMFIVTLLLENMLAWMRSLSGTTSLRALLYFDEVYGFFPHHPYNPPSKVPMLRLLKQARAFGLGLVLATQNPTDIDYKGLSNAGTWFIGKLQTENDKNRLLNGLETLETVDGDVNIADIDRLLSSIDPRVFIMHNVHDSVGAIPIHTRWAMSYLRGPLTRQQIKTLMADQRQRPYYPTYADLYGQGGSSGTRVAEPAVPPGATPPPATLPELPDRQATPPPSTLPDFDAAHAASAPLPEPTRASALPAARPSQPQSRLPEGFSMTQQPLPSSMAQYFLPVEVTADQAVLAWTQQTGLPAGGTEQPLLAYQPILIAQADVRYGDRKANVTEVRRYPYHVPFVAKAGLIHWDEFLVPPIDPRDLSHTPAGEAAFGALSPGLTDSKRMAELQRELVDYLYKAASLTLLSNPQLNLYSQPGMSQRDFLIQAQALARQARDAEIDKVMARYEKEFDKLETRLRQAARSLSADQQQLDELRNEELFTTGEAILSLLRGRTTYTLSRVSRSRRYKGRAQEDLLETEQIIAEMESQLDETQARMEQELAQVNAKWVQIASVVEEYKITPYKKDIYLGVFGIGWKPYWIVIANGSPQLVPARGG
mgnify:FL=1